MTKNKKYTKRSEIDYQAVVIGVSAGGINALSQILSNLSENFTLPIIIVQHLSARYENFMVDILNQYTSLSVKEADEKESIQSSTIYIAPPNYHLLIEENHSFSLSIDEHICYSRPSINVLFETAAIAYREKLIGVILTGANHDGSAGIKEIKDKGGLTIVQNPDHAEVPGMPKAALRATQIDFILDLEGIASILSQLST